MNIADLERSNQWAILDVKQCPKAIKIYRRARCVRKEKLSIEIFTCSAISAVNAFELPSRNPLRPMEHLDLGNFFLRAPLLPVLIRSTNKALE
jgi:hypothetical protein